MNSREKILNAIKQNKPSEFVLPSDVAFPNVYDNVVEKYVETLCAIGGKASVINDLSDVKQLLLRKQQEGVEVVNAIEGLRDTNILAYTKRKAAELEKVNTVFIKGEIAVAENSAVWISERNMGNRIFPFICQHLVILITVKNIVGNMHEAYEKIRVDEDGYGVFIAGPSKTADIEQSLVIGAHGPLSLQVFIII